MWVNVCKISIPPQYLDSMRWNISLELEFRGLYFRGTEFQNKELSQHKSLTAKKSHSTEVSQQRSRTAKKSHSNEVSQQGNLAQKFRSYIFNLRFLQEVMHTTLLSRIWLAVIVGILVGKLRFRNFSFQFLKDALHELRFWETAEVRNRMFWIQSVPLKMDGLGLPNNRCRNSIAFPLGIRIFFSSYLLIGSLELKVASEFLGYPCSPVWTGCTIRVNCMWIPREFRAIFFVWVAESIWIPGISM